MTEREYNECVKQYADNVYRFIVKNLRQTEDAQDVVQSAFEKLWVNRETVDPLKAKSYLFTLRYNQMIDHLRKVKRMNYKEELPDEALGTSDQPKLYLKKALENALATLNETQRSLVMLKVFIQSCNQLYFLFFQGFSQTLSSGIYCFHCSLH